jgi:O-antigen/teichoic acid export membrane protein
MVGRWVASALQPGPHVEALVRKEWSMSLSRGAAYSAGASATQIVVTLVTIPIYLSLIGLERYGVLVLVWLLFDYAMIFNLGLDKAAVSLLAKRRGVMPEGAPLLSTAVLLAGAAGMAGAALLGLALAPMLSGWMGVSAELAGEIGLGAVAVAGALWLTATGSVFGALVQAQERFLAWNSAQLVTSVIFQIAPLLAVFAFGPSLETVLVAGSASRCVMPILYIALARRGGARFAHFRPERAEASRLLGFGGWTSLTNLLSPLIINLDRMLISARLGPAAVGLYAVPYNLVMRIQVLPLALSSVLLPRLSQYEDVERRRLAEEALLALAVLLTPALAFAAFAIEPFLKLWVGDAFPPAFAHVGEALLVGIWFNALAIIPYVTLQAVGRPDRIARLHLMEILPFALLLWLAIEAWGVVGAAGAWSLRAVIDSLLLFREADLPAPVSPRLLAPFAIIMAAVGGAWALSGPLAVHAAAAGAAGLLALTWSVAAAPPKVRLAASSAFQKLRNVRRKRPAA